MGGSQSRKAYETPPSSTLLAIADIDLFDLFYLYQTSSALRGELSYFQEDCVETTMQAVEIRPRLAGVGTPLEIASCRGSELQDVEMRSMSKSPLENILSILYGTYKQPLCHLLLLFSCDELGLSSGQVQLPMAPYHHHLVMKLP